jgi:hypothetical protein
VNLYHAVEAAKDALKRGDYAASRNLIAWAEQILKKHDPDGTLGPVVPAICCHFRLQNGIIHCGSSENEPLFPAEYGERLKICAACRQMCRAELTALRQKLKMWAACEVTAVKRNSETRTVERVEMLLDKRFVVVFSRHPSKPRTLSKSMAADLGTNRMAEATWIPPALWKQAQRQAYAIFFPKTKARRP